MNIEEFRSNIKAGAKLIVEDGEYEVKQVIKFKFDDGTFYFKCFLNDNYVFADDPSSGTFLLVKTIKTSFERPFPEKLELRGKEFKFLLNAHAVAEEMWGEEIFKKGEGEKFWDYSADDNSYLSLGFIDETGERLDFYGKIVDGEKVNIKKDS